ncbi:MAG: hypothetical protein MUF42_12445 [Cytophagaceae bacterium]|jgi:hypothetical protein|nr:hypothetical protein [Cytophagaceae bacterium]
MKKFLFFVCVVSLTFAFTDCTRTKVNKKCKDNAKRIKNMRKNNPNFKM